MANFNIKEYDQVDDRIKKFYEGNPDGRITTSVIFQDGDRTMVKAYIYINKEDQENKIPKATGIAEEIRVMEKSLSKAGGEYEAVNFSSWTENCETSAIGRGLANMGLSGKKRPSRQEMEKVNRYSEGQRMATVGQISYLKSLGYKGLEQFAPEKLTFEEASDEITRLKVE